MRKIIALDLKLVCIAALLSCWAALAPSCDAWGAQDAPKHVWQKGMCYATWTQSKYASPESDNALKEMAAAGVEWVGIVTTWYQDRCSSATIAPSGITPSDESVMHAIDTARALGMKVMLKPHLDIKDTSDGSWRGDIGCASEPDWQTWFESYRDFMLHYASMAQEHNVEMFCMGTELTSVAIIREKMWKEIVIAPIRQAYKGPLTYAANWNDEYENVKFWDALDYVGIDAYFPLVDVQRPTFEEIKKGWEPWVKNLEEFQKKVNKPIIFPEVGYCSVDSTAKTPWEEIAGGATNMQIQEDCYRALLETFWDKPWFYGVYWWRWATNMKFGGPNNRGFVIQNKPVQKLVADWYHKPTPAR